MMHKSGRNDATTPGASTKNDMYLRDYITRKQESDSFFGSPTPKKLTFDEWWHQHNDEHTHYEHDRKVWEAAQENNL